MLYVTFHSVNGSWSDWAEWSSCSSSCDGGVRSRVRLCNDPLPLCDGNECEGRNEEVEDCNAELPCKYVLLQSV